MVCCVFIILSLHNNQMSYAQWNQYTQYVVGNQVVSAGVLYVCIANVGPTATLPASDPTKWTSIGPVAGGATGPTGPSGPTGPPAVSLPSGRVLFSNLTWTLDATNSNYNASITNVSASLTANSMVVASLQRTTGSIASTIQLAINCRLLAVETLPNAGGGIVFYVSNGADPNGQIGMSISWSVVAF